MDKSQDELSPERVALARAVRLALEAIDVSDFAGLAEEYPALGEQHALDDSTVSALLASVTDKSISLEIDKLRSGDLAIPTTSGLEVLAAVTLYTSVLAFALRVELIEFEDGRLKIQFNKDAGVSKELLELMRDLIKKLFG